MKIYGLTLTQPWAFGFALGKRVENRDWLPPVQYGEFWVALHGGKFPTGKKHEQACSDLNWLLHGVELEKDEKLLQVKYQSIAHFNSLEYCLKHLSREGVFAVARYSGWVDINTLGNVREQQHKWFFGKYGWVLTDLKWLKEPIPCRGAQKLWTLPPEVLAEIKTRLPNLEVS
jgi:hypothetical protein